MEYKNLDKAAAFETLKNEKKKDIRTLLTPERVKKSEVKLGGGLKYNWAAMPVDDKIIKDYQLLFPIPDTEITKSKKVLVQNPGY